MGIDPTPCFATLPLNVLAPKRAQSEPRPKVQGDHSARRRALYSGPSNNITGHDREYVVVLNGDPVDNLENAQMRFPELSSRTKYLLGLTVTPSKDVLSRASMSKFCHVEFLKGSFPQLSTWLAVARSLTCN